MNKPYEDLSTQGKHQDKPEGVEPSGMEVRAQEAPDLSNSESKPVYQLAHHESGGYYRLRTSADPETAALEEGYREIGRYSSDEDLARAIDELPERGAFIVMENSENGEVYYDRQANVTSGFTGSSDYDQVTFFRDEEKAAAYAQERESAREGRK